MPVFRSLSLLVSISCLVVVVACDLPTPADSNTMLGGTIVRKDGTGFSLPDVPYNAGNEYDSIGLRHNEAIIYALNWMQGDSVTQISSSTFLDSAEVYLIRYAVQIGLVIWPPKTDPA